ADGGVADIDRNRRRRLKQIIDVRSANGVLIAATEQQALHRPPVGGKLVGIGAAADVVLGMAESEVDVQGLRAWLVLQDGDQQLRGFLRYADPAAGGGRAALRRARRIAEDVQV